MSIDNVLIVLNLFFLESMLSVDNAAVLAIMVKDLPPKQRTKALRYGIWGAFGFRALCLAFASLLYQLYFLKVLGALYLLWLTFSHFRAYFKNKGEDEPQTGFAGKIHSYFINKIGLLWTTVIMVEFMDLSFSIDNIFAAVALTDKLPLIITGVCLGILAMRFIATWFVKLMEKYPSMAHSAFIVIGLLGLKLLLSDWIKAHFDQHTFDMYFSICMMLIFFAPMVYGAIVKTKTRAASR